LEFPVSVQPKIYHATDHDIDANSIDQDAVKIIQRLLEAGYSAYLVGGGVRDLLLKKQPKDYDISTSARPEQIKALFQRQCILIGRRFRLAHIRFGHKIFEVSTFRSGENDSDLIIQDNCWGTPEEDVLRRDFTINGMFYSPTTHTVIDYVGGWEDIHKRILRSIGDPLVRFRQDPVRMIRLLRFHTRTGFTIDSETKEALLQLPHEITKSSPARILEEMLRMLESGYSSPFFQEMYNAKLLKPLFPSLTAFLQSRHGNEVYNLLAAADTLTNHPHKKPCRAVLASSLLFPILEKEIDFQFLRKNITPSFGEIMELASKIIHGVFIGAFSHFPRKLSSEVHYILSMQYRLTPLTGKRNHGPRLLRQVDFAHALDFLKIRAVANPLLTEPYEWWARLVHGHRHNHGHESKNHH
jgi:poly(A) polymerase